MVTTHYNNDMQTQYIVSVVVPTFNRRPLLEECLKSLEAQSFPLEDFEVLVMDDGSVDDSKEFLETLKQETPLNLKVFQLNHGGIARARNRGIRESVGGIICFIDDDCTAGTDWIAELVKPFENEKIGCVGGKVRAYKTETWTEKYLEESGFFDQKRFRQKNCLIAGSSAFRKKVLEELNGYDEHLHSWEDIDVSIRVQLAGHKIAYQPDAVVYHRHPSSVWAFISKQSGYGRGYVMCHRKYPLKFDPAARATYFTLDFIRKIVTSPVWIAKSLGKRWGRAYLMKNAFDAILLASYTTGIVRESLFGKPYAGEKILDELSFIEERMLSELPGRIISKITR